MIPAHAALPSKDVFEMLKRDFQFRFVHRIQQHGERSLCGLRAVPMALDDEAATCPHCRDLESRR